MEKSIANNLAILRNAQNSHKAEAVLYNSKILYEIVKILRLEGYIRGFSLKSSSITVFLKYLNNKSPLNSIFLISKPSKRVFYTYKDLIKKVSHRGIFVLSTSKGILSSNDAIKKHLGGEVLFYIN